MVFVITFLINIFGYALLPMHNLNQIDITYYIVQGYLFHLTMHQKCALDNSMSFSHLLLK